MSDPKPKSINAILWLSFLAMTLQVSFAFLEGTMVVVAIHNQHYSLYLFGFAVLGFLFAWKAFQWRKNNPTMKGLALFVHIAFTIIMIAAFFIGMAFLLFMVWIMDYWS
jgi:hypothetical protein